MKRRWSIRLYLLGLMLALLAPLLGLLGWLVYTQAENSFRERQVSTMTLAQLTASHTTQLLSESELMLTRLAERPLVRAMNPSRCDPLFTDLLDLQRQYSNFLIINASGQILCSALPLSNPQLADVSNDPLFQTVQQTNAFAMLGPEQDSVAGKWVVRMAHPIRDETGRFIGVLGLGLNLSHYQNLFESHLFNPEMVISIINEQGIIIARSLEPEKWIGQNAAGVDIVDIALAQKQGQTVAVGVEGIERVYSFVTVPGTDWRVYAGIATAAVYAAARTVALRSVLFGLAVIVLVVALGYGLSRHIERPIRRLVQTIQSVSAGGREIRASLSGPAEVAELVAHFNAMLETQAQAEEALHRSEARYRSLIELSPEAIYVVQEYKIVLVNAACARLFGATDPGQIIGKSPLEFTHPDSLPLTQERIYQLIELGQPVPLVEQKIIRLDGTVIEAEVTAAPYDDQGVKATQVILHDITERKQMEAALYEAHTLVQAIVEASPLAISAIDREGLVKLWNPAAERTFGWSQAEVMGRLSPNVPAEAWPQVQAQLTEEFTGLQRSAWQVRRQHKDGSLLDIELWTAPLLNATGEITAVMGIMADITRRKQAEQVLHQQAERLKILNEISRDTLAQRSPAEIAETTLTHLRQLLHVERGTVALFNEEAGEMIILAAQTKPGSAFQAGRRLPYSALGEWLIPLRQSQVNMVEDILAWSQPSELVTALVAEGVRSYISLPLLAQGELIGGLNLGAYTPAAFTAEQVDIAREVADHLAVALRQARLFEQVQAGQKRLEALSRQLLEAQETERRRLAYELHDEIGQTLTAIKLNLQVLQRQPHSSPPPVSESIRMVEQAIEEVRDLSLNLRPSLLDDLGLAATLRWFLDRQAQRSGLNIQLRIDPPEMETPPHLNTVCFRVVQESLTNVVRHAQARQVWVELAARESELRLTIQDDGHGFALEESLKWAIQGVSVGLLGMQERVLLAGGRLEIDSAPGRGTAIRAWLPLGG